MWKGPAKYPKTSMNRAITRQSSQTAVFVAAACHAGGRWFESRRLFSVQRIRDSARPNRGPATFTSLDCTSAALLWSPGDIIVSNGISGRCSIKSGGRIDARGPAETLGILEANTELLLYGR